MSTELLETCRGF